MQIVCTLAGANFRPAEAKEALRAATHGTVLGLEPDPDNEYDANAVKVLLDQHFVGFLPQRSNAVVSKMLLDGDELTAEIIAFESALKPVLEIQL